MKRSATGYGLDHEHKMSSVVAGKLLIACGFPWKLRMGEEVCLRSIQVEGLELRDGLVLQNISGDMYLACTSRTKDSWKEVFAMDLEKPDNWKPAISHYYQGGEVAVFVERTTSYDLYADDSLEEHIGNVDSISAGKELLSQDAELEDDPDFQP